MQRWLSAVVLACLLALAGCGGHTSHQTVPAPAACAHGYSTPYGCQAHPPSFGRPSKGLTIPAPHAAVPTLEMFDSVSVSAIPRSARAVAGYLNGHWPTYHALVAAFPHAYHVAITVQAFPVYPSTAKMACLDSEPGDAPAFVVGAWVRGELGLGVKPCVYASGSDMPAVRASIAAAGVPRAKVLLWVADWTFHPGLFAGFEAQQWTNHGPNGENYDESTVTLAFLGVQPKPRPKPDPYAIYDKTRRHLRFGVVASEHNTLAAWDRAHCLNPVKRPVCKSSRFHMQLLRDRDIFVATHQPPRFQRRAHRYAVDHLGERVAGMQARLHQTKR